MKRTFLQATEELALNTGLPVVSLVMPAYNAEKYILESISSVKAQTEENWELIIVDDFSTDNTFKLVQQVAESDKRIHIYRMQGNKGPSFTRNFGIEKARGEFIAFLDADDLLSPTALCDRIAALQKHRLAGASYCDALLIDDLGVEIDYIILPPITNFVDLAENRFPTSLILLRASLLELEGAFDTSLRFGEDWDLWLRLTRTGRYFVKASDCKVYYRQYQGSLSRNVLEDFTQRMEVLDRAWGVDANCKHPIPEFKNGLGDAIKLALKIKRTFPTAMAELAAGKEVAAKQLMANIPIRILPLFDPLELAARCNFQIKRNLCVASVDGKKLKPQFKQFFSNYYGNIEPLFIEDFIAHLFPSGIAYTMQRGKRIVKLLLNGVRTGVLSPKSLLSLILGEKLVSLIPGRTFKRHSVTSNRAYLRKIKKQANHLKRLWQPLVSIVTPSYNHAEFIKETLDSVSSQDYPKIEHLIIDAGSEDGTLDILKAHEKDIKYISEPDDGQSSAINKGFKMATGEIVAWLNSDDVYYSTDAISAVVRFFSENPEVEVVYGRGDFVDKAGKFLREAYVHKDDRNLKFAFAWAVGILQPAVFFRRSVFDKVGYLDESNHTSMDYEFWLRLTHAGIKMRFLDKKIAKAKYHEDMKSSKTRGKQLSETLDIVRKYYGFVHPRWINVYARYLATSDVQIISSNGLDDEAPEVQRKIKELEQQLFVKYNSLPEVINELTNPRLCDQKIAREYLNKYMPDWQSVVRGTPK